jgi:GT2 family glycosyltransferase
MKPATIMIDWDHNESKTVDQVMGSFVLIKRSVFKSLKGFYEILFVYFEYIDLAKRLTKIGFTSFYLNDVSIIHTGCGASDSVKDARLFYSLSSRIRYVRKHLGKFEASMVLLITIFPEPLTRMFYALFANRSLKDVKNIAKAYKMFYRWLITG